jgi:hypothetical protein
MDTIGDNSFVARGCIGSKVSPSLSGDGFSVGFSDRAVTAWGGLALLKRMLDSLGFREAVGSWDLPTPGSNRGYAPVQLIEQFIVAIWCGASRFAHAEAVRFDRPLTRLFNWDRVAGHKAIVRLFERFDMLTNERVQAAAYGWIFDRIATLKRLTLDMDSTVLKGVSNPGEHTPIIDQTLWDKLRMVMTDNAPRKRANAVRSQTPAPLKGLIHCSHCGRAMTPTSTRKKGRLYRYYTGERSI